LLVAHGLLQAKSLSNFLGPGEHEIPSPSPDQSVLFVSFVRAGLCYPPSDFLLELLESYGIQIHHLTPNGVLFLSAFAHFCEVYVGIPPYLLLFHYFFRVRLSDGKDTPFLGCCLIQSRQGVSFPSLALSNSVKNWAEKWFYISKPAPYFSHDLSALPTPLSIWKNKLFAAETAALKPVLARVKVLQQLSLTGNCIVASFLRRRVQPLMQRVHYGFEYSGPSYPSRLVADAELTEEMILESMGRILGVFL